MQVNHSNGLNSYEIEIKREADEKVHDFALRLKYSLAISDRFLADVMGLSNKEYSGFIHDKKAVNLTQVHRLCEYFNFSLKALLDGQVDIDCLKRQYFRNRSAIPEKYTRHAFSKKRLIKTVSDYVNQNYHWSITEEVLSYFQVQSISYSDPDAPINVYLFEDILRCLKSMGFTDTHIRNIGRQSIKTSQGTPFERQLSQFFSPKEMFECYFNEMVFFIEKNNHYRISYLDHTRCEVESHEISDLLDAFKVKHVGGVNRCIYRAGALGAVTQYIGFPESTVSEIQCAHLGADLCKFESNCSA